MALVQTTYTSISAAQATLNFKADMVAQGWSVAISTDGATYNGSGDQITTATSGAGGIDNANVFFVLRQTGAPDWLFVRGSDSTFWLIWVSPTGAFSGGSTTTRPTAPDERVLFDDANSLFQGSPLDYVEIQAEDTTPYRWGLLSTVADLTLFVASVGAVAASPILLAKLPYVAGATFYAASETDAWTDVVALLSEGIGGGGGGGDATPPTIGTWTPASGSNRTRTQTVAVTVTDDTALEQVVVTAELADGTVLTVYDGTAFVGPFAASSTLVSNVYTIVHDAPGWPSASVEIRALAVDTSGNSATASASYTITNPPQAPVVDGFDPPDGSSIQRTDPIQFDVTDDEGASALPLIRVGALLADERGVLVHTGSLFTGDFGSSTRTPIPGGYRYVVQHDAPGWPTTSVQLLVDTVDAQGRVTELTSYGVNISNPPAAPVVDAFDPATGGTILRSDSVEFDVTDDEGALALALILVHAVLEDGSARLVHDGSVFLPPFTVGSSRTSITGGYHYVVAWDSPGCPGTTVGLSIDAVDAQGRVTTATWSATVSNPLPPTPTPDTTAPEIGSPTPATSVKLTRSGEWEVTVTDDEDLDLVEIFVLYAATGDYEVAYDGEVFAPRYVAKSTRTNVTGGYRFKLVRTGGWPSPPTFKVRARDAANNEA